jgi:hypothetical protein
MAKKFKKGDKVKINPKSEYKSQGFKNGEYMVGEINRDNQGDSYIYQVNWENGDWNNYRAKDLILHIDSPTYEIY